jgi:DNA repair protein RecO (recombination protein O)
MPARARQALRAWVAGRAWPLDDEADGRAHQRLLREFLAEHLGDGTPMRAFEVWERGGWHLLAPTAVPAAATLTASDGG